jgi:phage recombination protein Bet
MARILRKQEVVGAVKTFCELHPEYTKSLSDNGGITLMPGDVLISCSAEGRLQVSSPDAPLMQSVHDKLIEIIMEMPQEPARAPTPRSSQGQSLTRRGGLPSDAQVSSLTTGDIIEYLCPKATEQEAYMFLQLCKARGLNPFLKEAYLIKYGDSPATMVVGKEHFTKTAEKNPQFDGFEAGIILKTESGTIERREGTFMMPEETLLGGWAKVWRKDRKMPFVSDVNLKDFLRKTQSGRSPWDTMPAVMIRKVPLVQSLREAFPNDLSGCYDRAEMDQAIDAEYEVQG